MRIFAGMIVRIYGENPSARELARVVAVLERDGTIVCPADGGSLLACSLRSPRAVERLLRLSGRKSGECIALFDSLSRLAEYCRVDNRRFRMLRRNLPGPFVCVLEASSRVPDRVLGRRKHLAAALPGHPVARAVVEAAGVPLLAAPLPAGAEAEADLESIRERCGREVEMVVDGGPDAGLRPATVDLTGDEPEVLREGDREWVW